ncbi:MAG: methyltransferase domain-containing protein [Dokdonella sp.]
MKTNRFTSNFLVTLFSALMLYTTTSARADAGEGKPLDRYTQVPAGADGIGKRYMGRDIAGVMGWQGAAWLEREEREREERTDLLVKALRLKPGMVVADIGAGTGYLARRMAPSLVPDGAVFAVDVQPQMVSMLEDMVRSSGMTQIKPMLGAEDDVGLPESSVDLAIMVDVYHELAFPHEVLASMVRSLKPDGQIAFVEYRAEDPDVPIKALHKMSEAQIKREAAVHPLEWERTVRNLPWQHLVVFRKRSEERVPQQDRDKDSRSHRD